jgi:hypothetical protein
MTISDNKRQKYSLFNTWLEAHAEGQICKIFTSIKPKIIISESFYDFINKYAFNSKYLYILIEMSHESGVVS